MKTLNGKTYSAWVGLILGTILLINPSNMAEPQHLKTDLSSLKACGEISEAFAPSGDTLQTPNGQLFRLAGVKAPEVWSDGLSYNTWPYGDKAQQALMDLINGHSIVFHCEKKPKDRNGALIAHAVRDDGLWLQAALLKAGHVLFFPLPNTIVGLDDLYNNEIYARSEKRGLWAPDSYRPLSANNPKTLKDYLGRFVIIRGKVHDVAKVGSTIFVNFDEDWRQDFTIEITDKVARLFKETDKKLFEMKGKTVEVRGWLDQKAGPRILLLAPGHLITLGETQ